MLWEGAEVMDCICQSDDLIFKGKRPSQLTLTEAVQAATYFRAIAVRQFEQLASMAARMALLEEAQSKEDVKKLDAWIKDHPNGQSYRGDGSPYYQDWRKYTLPPEQRR